MSKTAWFGAACGLATFTIAIYLASIQLRAGDPLWKWAVALAVLGVLGVLVAIREGQQSAEKDAEANRVNEYILGHVEPRALSDEAFTRLSDSWKSLVPPKGGIAVTCGALDLEDMKLVEQIRKLLWRLGWKPEVFGTTEITENAPAGVVISARNDSLEFAGCLERGLISEGIEAISQAETRGCAFAVAVQVFPKPRPARQGVSAHRAHPPPANNR